MIKKTPALYSPFLAFIVLVTFLAFIYLLFLKNSLTYSDFIVELTLQSKEQQTITIYHDIGRGYNETDKTNIQVLPGGGSQKAVVKTGNNHQLKAIRLDFEKDLRIKSIKILSSKGEILLWNHKEIYKNIITVSESVDDIVLDKEYLALRIKGGTFSDPYLKFTPLMKAKSSTALLNLFLILGAILFVSLKMRSMKRIFHFNPLSGVSLQELAILFFVFAWLTGSQLLSISIIIMALIGIHDYVKTKKTNQLPHYIWLFPIIYLVRIIWLPKSPDLSYGAKYLETQLSFIVFPMIFLGLSIQKVSFNKVSRLIIHLIVLVLLSCFYWLMVELFISDISFLNYLKNLKPYSQLLFGWSSSMHPSYFAMFVNLVVLLTFYMYNRRKLQKLELYTVLILSFIIILLSASRVALAMFSLITTFLFINKKQWFIIGIICFGFLIIFFFVADINIIDYTRLQMWSTGWAAIKSNFWVGLGTGANKAVLHSEELAQSLGFAYALKYTNPHNQFINEAIQFGIIGTLPLLAALFFSIKYSLDNKDILLAIFLAFEITFMMVETPLNTIKGITFFMFFLLYLLSTRKQRKPKYHHNNRHNQ